MARPESIQWQHRRWLGDKDVLAMDWDAKAMHFHLLLMSIQEQPPGSIPNDMAAIRRWLHLSPDAAPRCQSTKDCRCDECVWRRVRPQIFAAWKLRVDRWFNQGMVETFERKEKYNTRYETGTKTGRESPENQENSNSIKELDFDVGSKESKPVFKRQEDLVVIKKVAEPYLAEIYKQYPRKIGRAHALKEIAAALKRLLDGQECPEQLFASMDDAVVFLLQRTGMFARSAAGQAGKFTPHPATWFHQARYLDDEMEWRRVGDGQVSKKQQQVAHNQGVLVEGFFGADAESGGESDELRDSQRGNKALGAAAGLPPGRN